MTYQHPLEMFTDGVNDSMRAAYDLGLKAGRDDQLKQVMKWLKENLHGSYYLRPEGHMGYEIDTSDVIEDLKEATCPQENSGLIKRATIAAYDLGRDERLTEVMKWLDENIAHYHYRHYYDTGEYPRPIRRWDKLTEHLKEAMRPKEDS